MARPRAVSLYGLIPVSGSNRFLWKSVEFHPKSHQPVGLKNVKGKKPLPLKKASGFVIRYSENGQRLAPRFTSLDEAIVAYRNRQHDEAHPQSNTAPIIALSKKTQRVTIKQAAQKYLDQIQKDVDAQAKSVKTLQAYRAAILGFANNTSATFMDYGDITEDVMMAHLNWLRTNIGRRKRGYLENTIANHFRNLRAFFTANGLKLVKSKNSSPDAPGIMSKFPKERMLEDEDLVTGVATYADEDIRAMLKLATVDEADLVNFALRTGFRSAEIAHAEWSDIDWTGKRGQGRGSKPTPFIICQNKSQSEFLSRGFRTKSGRARKIEIPSLIPRLKARQARMIAEGEKSTLIFPNSWGKPNDDRLRQQLQDLVMRVEKGSAKAKPHHIDGEIGLHRFRKSFATTMYDACGKDALTVKMLLGHRKLETALRYLGLDREKAASASRSAFEQFGD